MEIESVTELRDALRSRLPVAGLRLQGLDLTGCEEELRARADLSGMVVLGGRLSAALTLHLIDAGAVVFPSTAHAPIDPYRSRLYDPEELYQGLVETGYAATLDARAYAWNRRARVTHDVFVSMIKAIHDNGIADALLEAVEGGPVVGVMGGHAVRRGEPRYLEAARLGRGLSAAGLQVATGGGPGAMEAVNLGASCPDTAVLEAAVAELARVPTFDGHVESWARLAFAVRDRFALGPAGGPVRSVGVPTWFYGHEPPNVFCDAVAKFFSNAVREDELLARCRAGLIILPGAAGTVQEIFQALTPRFYARNDPPVPPLALVGREYWTQDVPVWPVLQRLGELSAAGDQLYLLDTTTEAVEVVTA